MSDFDKLCAEIAARPGAEARITAEVERMNRVLELEKLRARKKLTQSEVAARMGLSQRRVSAIEHTGSGEIKIDTLRRYVESLGGRLEVSAVVDGDHIPLSLG
jgi:DNA-binding Xre family transcriptional regulator